MKKQELKAFAGEVAKSIKTGEDLNEFSQMLTRVTVEAALNAELDDHLGYRPPRTIGVGVKYIIPKNLMLWRFDTHHDDKVYDDKVSFVLKKAMDGLALFINLPFFLFEQTGERS